MTPATISNKSPQFLFDSNFLIALLDDRDVHHTRARQLLENIQQQQEGGQYFISDVLMNEVLSVFGKRCESKGQLEKFSKFAKKFQMLVREYPILCFYEFLPHHYKEIASMMVQYEGRLNFHDCLMVFFLKEVSNVTLLSFDRDFESVKEVRVMGFNA